MSGLRSFGGEFRKAQKVSLVGRSRGEETRAEVLERTRRERERRRRERQEQSAATAIQVRRAWCGGWDSCLMEIVRLEVTPTWSHFHFAPPCNLLHFTPQCRLLHTAQPLAVTATFAGSMEGLE